MVMASKLTDEQALKMAITFEQVYPEPFKRIETLLRNGATSDLVTSQIRALGHLDTLSAMQYAYALIKVCV